MKRAGDSMPAVQAFMRRTAHLDGYDSNSRRNSCFEMRTLPCRVYALCVAVISPLARAGFPPFQQTRKYG